jgi:hypothetical protein
LNAAQVWRYFTVYSSTANKLPNLPELEERLQEAIHVYKQALAHPNAGDDSNIYYKACGLFKIFLLEASELGHRVWTRFDTVGMFLGGAIILVTLLLSLALLYMGAATLYLPQAQNLEVAISVVFIIFQSGMLSFSNSYIEAEQAICMFMLAVLGVLIYIRMSNHPGNPGNVRILPILALVVPVLSRIGETMVSGHGLDPSIRLHLAHNSAVFLSSLAVLITMRIQIYRKLATKVKTGLFHAVADCIAMLFLALGWIEKRNPDVTRNGYLWVRAVIAILILCTPITIYEALCRRPSVPQSEKHAAAAAPPQDALLARSLAAISKLLLALITVTGPSTAASVVLVSTQAWILYILGGASGPYQVRVWICCFGVSYFLFLSFRTPLTLILHTCLLFAFIVSDILGSTSYLMEACDSTRLLCDQSRMCVQSIAIFCRLCGLHGVFVCARRRAALSQHLWLGNSGPCTSGCDFVHIAKAISLEMVLPLSIDREFLFLYFGRSTTPSFDGLGRVCATVSLCVHLFDSQCHGSTDSLLLAMTIHHARGY